MNDQPAPIDSDLREQLARRAAGRLPDGLLDGVLTALDSAPTPVAIAGWPRVACRVPRLAVAGVGAALVAILAVAVALPALRGGPASPLAGYPADRALTTAELAELLAGPPLATNTPLVVSATIDVRTDVCPMDRYPTAGVIDGMDPQVCVMQGGLPPELTGTTVTGTFAFRYLGLRTLGLLGQITPASASRLAFHVTEDWPLAGKTFLVDAWLGATADPSEKCIAPAAAEYGDPLDPVGSDCPYGDWLSNSGSPAPATSPESVEAGGARHFDSIDVAAPVKGVFVVRSVVEQCPSAPPQSNVGCSVWRVLAKVADISLPQPTPPPTATATPLAGYPADRALTTAELGRLLDSGSLKEYDTVLVDAEVSASASGACQTAGIPDLEFAGFIAGIDTPPCVYAVPNATITPGHLLLRVLAGRTLGYILTAPDAPSGFAYSATDAWPQGDFLVHGWLGTDARDCGRPAAQPTMVGYGLFPDGRVMCYAALTATKFDPTQVVYTGPTPAGPPRIAIDPWDVPADGQAVDPGPMFSMPNSSPTSGAVEGTYVVSADHHCSEYGTDCVGFSVLTRLADVVVPAPTTTATPSPQATPTAQPSLDTPYPTSRVLTSDELGRFLQTDGIKDKVLVAQVTLGKTSCPPVGSYVPMGNVVGVDGVCVVGIGDGRPEHSPSMAGPYAFRVLDSHTLGFMGDISSPSADRLDFTSADAWPDGKTILVSGWHTTREGIFSCPMIPAVIPDPLDPGAIPCGGTSMVTEPQSGPVSATPPLSAHPQSVWWPDYPDGGLQTPDGEATYLLRDTNSDCSNDTGRYCGWRILAVVDSITLPAATPTPGPTASSGTTLSTAGLWGSGDRPLTVAEFPALWAADPQHLAGRIVIVKGPVPTGFECWSAGAADAGISPPPCHITILDGWVAQDGYWAVRVGADGKLAIVGQVATTQGSFVFTLEQAVAAWDASAWGDLLIVDASLYWTNDCRWSTEPLATACSTSVLSSEHVEQQVQPDDAYQLFGSKDVGQAIEGLYLVDSKTATILARLEVATP